jgi:hypothetical protein
MLKFKSTQDGCRGFRFDISILGMKAKGLVRLRSKKSRGFNRQVGKTMTMYNCYKASLALQNKRPLRLLSNFAG